ncbi:MAG: peptidylprolyl isomerase [Burkholderiales bacterium]|jgi:peptidyl-prolyl cis-trans isomerase C|nr:peptidylprolyl isomerase [Burkholderiales bacterium]
MTKTSIAGALLMALFSISVAAQTPAAKADAPKAAAKTDAAKPTAVKVTDKAPVAKKAEPQGKTLYSKEIFDFYLKQRVAQGQPDSPELRDALREELNSREVLIREAKKNGFDKQADVKTEIQLSGDMVLIRAYLNDWVHKNPISDDVLKKEYEALKAQLGDKEYKVSHILVETEDEAKAIIGDLQKGKKFADIAKEKSKDPGSKDKGGDLGWNTPSSFVKPFGDAMPKVEKGKFTTTPVQSQYGWHVIMIEDVRDTKLPSFEDAKPQLQQRAQAQWVEKYVKELREKAGV